MDALEILSGCGIVPVLVIEDETSAVDLALALRDAGITAIEVTLRTSGALSAIEAIASQVQGLAVGAGSIRNPEHISHVMNAGAAFAVSPGATPTILDAAEAAVIPFVPGAVTASEVLALMEKGYRLQKFFPAQLSGGVAMLKALNSPLPEVVFFPTGGINGEVATQYLELSCVACIGGSWFVPREKLAERRFHDITRLAKEAMQICHG